MVNILIGAVSMAAAIAGLFFLRFWRTTSDRFFLLFALAFFLEAASRLYGGITFGGDGDAAMYLARLGSHSLIICAIVDKNLRAASRK